MTAHDDDHEKPAHTEETSPLIVWGGAAGILALLAGVFFLSHGDDHAKEEKSAAAPSVTVMTVAERPFSQDLSLAGEARPKVDVRVYAPTTGVRVTKLLVDEGATVREGQPLAKLDASVANAQISAAQASVAEAQSAQVRAADEYKRAESIRESGALSAEAIAARAAAAKAADARLAAAQAQLAEINARLQGGYVRAPNAGLVIERTAQVGQLVDGQPLFRIVGGNALEVGVEVGEADMLAMRPGQTATFRLVDGTEITGRLRRVPAAIDSATRTGEAVFDLPLHPKLRAGMFLRGEADLPARNVLAAPQTAITFEDRQAMVFVVGENNRVKRTPVTIGARADGLVAIESGVAAGQVIVVGGAAFLQDGDAVAPVRNDATPAAAPAAPAKESSLRGRSGG
ncbi:MAG: efflux RND transporter periplasmic adaptor subunit [Hyphomonadaceae bacterium]|nr:efflux RND transporter periplasmic adaptor subunit [Hyphomonadaceae bacterium]